MTAYWIVVVMLLIFTIDNQVDPEHPIISTSSTAFRNGEVTAIRRLSGNALELKLRGPTFGSTSDDNFVRLRDAIKEEAPIANVSEGEREVQYDVILQPGHYGRPPGRVGTSGKIVSERALVAFITRIIADKLRESGYKVLVVSADKYLKPKYEGSTFHGLTAKVFLAIHADGSEVPCSTGPSLGYKSRSDVLAMHAIGWALGKALGYDYSDFNRDNFTVNEAHYYMFTQVHADRITGLLEIGELTCGRREKQLISSSELIGGNVAEGIKYIVKMPTQ